MKIAKILHYCTAIAGCIFFVSGILFAAKTCSDSIASSLIIFISMALSGCLFFLFSAFFEDLITLEERISDLESQYNKRYKSTTPQATLYPPNSNETSPAQSKVPIAEQDLDKELADAKAVLTNRLNELKREEKCAIENGDLGTATKLKSQIKNLSLQIKNL